MGRTFSFFFNILKDGPENLQAAISCDPCIHRALMSHLLTQQCNEFGPTPLRDLDNWMSDGRAQPPPARACSMFC